MVHISNVKITQVIRTLEGGGAEILAVNLHKAYLEAGHESHLIAVDGNCPEGLPGASVVSRGSPYRLGAAWALLKALRKLKLTRENVLHVHLFPMQFYVAMFRALGLIRCRLFTTEHNIYNRRRDCQLFRLLDRWTYRRYDCILCISQGVMESLNQWAGPFRDIRVAYNGIYLEAYRAAYQAQRSKPQAQGTFEILSVGSLTEQKNFPFMIEVLAACKDLRWHWSIAGRGPLLESLKDQARAVGLESRITFLGFVSDIPERMAACDLFLHLPAWEGFGLVVVEAMAAGCPVLASDVDGLNEIIRRDQHEGTLVKLSDKAAVVAQLRAFIEGKAGDETTLERARKRAEVFSFKHMFDQYMKAYREAS